MMIIFFVVIFESWQKLPCLKNKLQTHFNSAQSTTFRTLMTFHYIGCLIGILVVVYYYPHISG